MERKTAIAVIEFSQAGTDRKYYVSRCGDSVPEEIEADIRAWASKYASCFPFDTAVTMFLQPRNSREGNYTNYVLCPCWSDFDTHRYSVKRAFNDKGWTIEVVLPPQRLKDESKSQPLSAELNDISQILQNMDNTLTNIMDALSSKRFDN
jgi:hypothetical protein